MQSLEKRIGLLERRCDRTLCLNCELGRLMGPIPPCRHEPTTLDKELQELNAIRMLEGV